MRYSKIRKFDVSNGPGIRATLFVTGCTHKCEDCFNEELQDFKAGDEYTKDTEELIIEYMKNPMVVGINILGGEPLQQTMDDNLVSLLRRIKEEVKGKTIWLWTGDLFEAAVSNPKKLEIIKEVDVVIDGKFDKKKRNIKLKYRGSSNQRVIDVKKTLSNCLDVNYITEDEIILYNFTD